MTAGCGDDYGCTTGCMKTETLTVQIEVGCAELLQRLVELSLDLIGLVRAVPDLARDEQILSLHNCGDHFLERAPDLHE